MPVASMTAGRRSRTVGTDVVTSLDGHLRRHHCVSHSARRCKQRNAWAGRIQIARELHRRNMGGCPAGRTPGDPLPGRRRAGRRDRRVHCRRHRGRHRRRPGRLRHRSLGSHQRPRARRPPAPGRRPAPARQGRDGADGVARHRQAPGRERDRHRRRHQRLPPLRPGGRRRGGPGRRHRARRRGQPGGARARRGVRADHPVELPAAAGLVEGRARARGGLHLRAEAERALPAHRDPPDEAARRGRPARRRRATWWSATDRTPVPR